MTNIQVLSSIYYDPKNPGSFSSANRLYNEAKKIDGSIKLRDVKEWLSGEFTYSLHKPVRKTFTRNPIIVRSIDDQWEADLVDMQEFSNQNSKYRYILTVIDVFSKFAWVQPLINKTSGTIINAFNLIFKEGRKPKFIRTDQGTEFKNQYFKNFMKRENCSFYK
jgi:Integrase core domain